MNYGDIVRGNVLITEAGVQYRSMKNRMFQDVHAEGLKQKQINKSLPESGSQCNILIKPNRYHMKDYVFEQYLHQINQILSPIEQDIDKTNITYILSQLKFDNMKNISA